MCPVEIASKAEIRDTLGWQNLLGIKRILARPSMEAFRRNGFVVELHFWPKIKNAPKARYLSGYWQSEQQVASMKCNVIED